MSVPASHEGAGFDMSFVDKFKKKEASVSARSRTPSKPSKSYFSCPIQTFLCCLPEHRAHGAVYSFNDSITFRSICCCLHLDNT